MSKEVLVNKMAENGMTKADAGKAVDAFTEAVTQLMADGQDITLVGFGKFQVRDRAARTGRNPQTGAEMQIPATKVASFSSGKKLKDAVKGK